MGKAKRAPEKQKRGLKRDFKQIDKISLQRNVLFRYKEGEHGTVLECPCNGVSRDGPIFIRLLGFMPEEP